jgi:tRNA-modifying protein YgfZ
VRGRALQEGPLTLTLSPEAGERGQIHDVGWFDVPSSVIIGPRDLIEQRQRELIARGVIPGSEADWQSIRIAAGFPLYGVDLTEDNLPQEAARNAQCLSFTKGCYLGQEPIARLDAMGHTNRELRRLGIAGDEPPVTPVALTDAATGQEAGRLTSAAVSPDGGGCVGLGVVKTKWLVPGTELRVGDRVAVVQPV